MHARHGTDLLVPEGVVGADGDGYGCIVIVKIIDRYILREIVPTFFLALLGLTFFMVTFQIVKSIEFLLRYQISAWIIAESYLYYTPIILVLTIPMATLIGILLAFGRLSGDSEVIAMKAGGISTARMFVPALIFSFGPWAVCQVLFWWALPQAEFELRNFKFELAREEVTPEVKPRQFIDFIDNTILFVREISADNRVYSDVFIYQNATAERPASVIVGDSMRKIVSDEATVFHLEDAYIHSQDPDNPGRYYIDEGKTLDFDVASMIEELKAPKAYSMMTAAELLETVQIRIREEREDHIPGILVELYRRVSIPLACLIFPLLGVSLGITNRRGGKSSGFAVAVVLFTVYYMLMILGERMGRGGSLHPLLAVSLPTIGLGTLGAALLYAATKERSVDIVGLISSGVGRLWRLFRRLIRRPAKPKAL